MNLNLFVLGLIILAPQASLANADMDRFGEALLFGRNHGSMRVEGTEGNVVQDEYGDVKVVFCSPGNWMIFVDPNHCGYAMAHGMGCTELATSLTGPWTNKFAKGNHYLSNPATGQKLVIKSIGDSKYSIQPLSRMKPVQIWQAPEPLAPSDLRFYCRD